MWRHTIMKHAYLHRGDMMTMQKGMVTACVWRDRRMVTSMSTCTQPLARFFADRRMGLAFL